MEGRHRQLMEGFAAGGAGVQRAPSLVLAIPRSSFPLELGFPTRADTQLIWPPAGSVTLLSASLPRSDHRTLGRKKEEPLHSPSILEAKMSQQHCNSEAVSWLRPGLLPAQWPCKAYLNTVPVQGMPRTPTESVTASSWLYVLCVRVLPVMAASTSFLEPRLPTQSPHNPPRYETAGFYPKESCSYSPGHPRCPVTHLAFYSTA